MQVLEELRRRVTLTAAALPSVCLYTFHHTAAALNCATVSSDAALVAGGFADSSVRVWDFDRRPAQPSGASALCDARPSNPAARRMSGLRRTPWSHRRTENIVRKPVLASRDSAADPPCRRTRQSVAEDPSRRVVRCSDSLSPVRRPATVCSVRGGGGGAGQAAGGVPVARRRQGQGRYGVSWGRVERGSAGHAPVRGALSTRVRRGRQS